MIALDRDMPEACAWCPCFNGEEGACQVTGQLVGSCVDPRPELCPWIEVQDEKE